MDGEAILAVIDAHGPAQASEIVSLLAAEGVEATGATTAAALRKLESQGKVACTPRENWRLAGALAAEHTAASRAKRARPSSGARVRAFIYCPEMIRDAPRLTRNTVLHYSAMEGGGFRLRDYVDGHRVEVKAIGGISKTVFLEAAYSWTQFEFDDDEAQTPLTDNAFWTQRLAAMNASHAEMLALGEPVAGAPTA
ncbi:MAG: hypothetical protein WBJ62_10850 [Coriobacteriia bacterium]